MITPELLQKYAQKDCTAVERATVERWLAAEDDQFCDTPVSPADQIVKALIWDNVYANTIRNARSFKRNVNLIPNICYPVAAMLLIIAGLYISKRGIDPDKHVVIDNLAGNRAIIKTIGDLTYLVEPGSRCELVVSGKNNESDLKFCGAVSVANYSGENSELRIKTGLLTCTNKFSDELTVRNGQTYLAMTDDQYNVIAATTDELKEGIPGPFSAKLHQRFSL